MKAGEPADGLDAWMVRLADGDRSVFTDVFHTLWPPTLRLCTKLLRHDEDAADAAQEALKKILERASEYDATRPAMPWAMAIAAWECRTIARRRTRRREVAEDVEGERAGDDGEAAFVERDLARAAIAALGDLSESDRATLIATYWDESGATGPTVRKRRERSLGRLREIWRRLYGLDG